MLNTLIPNHLYCLLFAAGDSKVSDLKTALVNIFFATTEDASVCLIFLTAFDIQLTLHLAGRVYS